MKIIITACISVLTLALIACQSKSYAGSEKATYLESVDEYNTMNVIKLVDEESGCKYLVINTPSNHGTSRPELTQMLGKDGLPICE